MSKNRTEKYIKEKIDSGKVIYLIESCVASRDIISNQANKNRLTVFTCNVNIAFVKKQLYINIFSE